MIYFLKPTADGRIQKIGHSVLIVTRCRELLDAELGVYAPRRPRRALGIEIIPFRSDKLPRRRPHVVDHGDFPPDPPTPSPNPSEAPARAQVQRRRRGLDDRGLD